MPSYGLGDMFEGDFVDMCAKKCPLMSMGDRAEGLASADPVVRIPIGVSLSLHEGNSKLLVTYYLYQTTCRTGNNIMYILQILYYIISIYKRYRRQ